MPANLASFALHVDDLDRARAFYEAVFGWEFEPWGPPGFYLIHTGDDASPGIQGLMHRRSEPRTGTGPTETGPAETGLTGTKPGRPGTGLNGIEPTFAVDDVDAVAERVTEHGGTITVTRSTIPTVGTLIRFLDPEGNDIGAMQYDHTPHT